MHYVLSTISLSMREIFDDPTVLIPVNDINSNKMQTVSVGESNINIFVFHLLCTVHGGRVSMCAYVCG